jgi:hypothetical protein
MFFDSAREEKPERECTVLLACIDNNSNELRYIIFVIALIESVDDDDYGAPYRQYGENGVSRRQHGFSHQCFELIFERSGSNGVVAAKGPLDKHLCGGNRHGKLIHKRRNQMHEFASLSCPSQEEETAGKPVLSITPFSDSL